MLAFKNDNMGDNEFRDIIKLNEYDFEGAHDWFHLVMNDIMNVTDGSQVLPVKCEKDKVHIAKLIPLLTFLVPHFMNGGEPQDAVAAFQAFTKDFYDTALPPLKLCAEYILQFLLVAMGFEETEGDSKVSQLAMEIDEIHMDPILMQLATTHFSSVQKGCRTV